MRKIAKACVTCHWTPAFAGVTEVGGASEVSGSGGGEQGRQMCEGVTEVKWTLADVMAEAGCSRSTCRLFQLVMSAKADIQNAKKQGMCDLPLGSRLRGSDGGGRGRMR